MKQTNHLRAFCETVADITLFPYQMAFLKDCLEHDRIAAVFGRQTGKTTCTALFLLYYAIQNEKHHILVAGPTEDQAFELFSRAKSLAERSGIVRPFLTESLQTELVFSNGSTVTARTTGDTGDHLRGKTLHVAVLEESELIKDAVITEVIMPMLATTRGKLIKIGTPKLKNHLYYSLNNERWRAHRVPYTCCPLITEEFITEQKEQMTDMAFRQEWMAEFVENADSFFTAALIESCLSSHKMVMTA